jgi:thiamine transport system ATP-binding protein
MLALRDVLVSYPGFDCRYTLDVPRGSLCALVGPSGGGKTTLLSAIAGFEPVAAGTMTFDGLDLLPLAPARRPVSMLFQDWNLFPHLDAASNVGLGIRPDLRLTPADRTAVAAVLARVGLAGMDGRRPADLSGGERQRVALARALVMRRPLMLLDEAFAALDPGLRRDMLDLVDALRREHGLTVLMSIHTPDDVAALADSMAFVAEGRIRAVGPPAAILGSDDPVVVRFLGRKAPAGPRAC